MSMSMNTFTETQNTLMSTFINIHTNTHMNINTNMITPFHRLSMNISTLMSTESMTTCIPDMRQKNIHMNIKQEELKESFDEKSRKPNGIPYDRKKQSGFAVLCRLNNHC
jgi:hypothetical protein